MTRPQIQAEIPGTEPPPDPVCTPDLDAQVHSWLDALDSQKRAAADTKLRHLVLLAKLAEAGVTRYPYVDRAGKRCYVVVARDPKARTIKAPKPKSAKQEAKADKAKEKREKAAADSVEHRKVSREAAERDLGRKLTVNGVEVLPPVEDDPFERTRRAMDGL